jgi:hypothetical protein
MIDTKEQPRMNAILPSIISEFETAEQEASYTAWLQAKTAASIADQRPSIPHDEIERRMAERLANTEMIPKATERANDRVRVLGRFFSPGAGSLLYLLAVFIRSCKEKCMRPLEFMVTRQNVGDNRRIGMANVGYVVDVADRRGNVEFLRHFYSSVNPELTSEQTVLCIKTRKARFAQHYFSCSNIAR